MNAYPSAAEIDRLLSYDPNTGEFRWKARPDDAAFTTRRAGTVAGRLVGCGYIQIRVMYQYCMAHRLAWILTHGVEPEGDIDHINLNRADNRAVNLRQCTRSQNKANTVAPVTNSSGAKGVNWFAKAGKWRARIKVNGKEHHLGLFAEKSDAMAAYAKAAALHFGQFARAA
jgi:hypothetical protein